MNIHKYLFTASIAATMHVALLWLMPEQPYTRIIELPLKAGPVKPPGETPVPPEDPAERTASPDPVKPLKGEPAPPTLPEVPAPAESRLPIPVENRPAAFDRSITGIPQRIGTADGVPGGIDLSGVTLFTPDALDRVPRATLQIPPDYPPTMKQSGAGGSVLVEFDVDTTGRVVRAGAIRYTDREFADPAVRAVRKWKFEPGRRNGKAVPFRMAVPIEFGIGNN